MIVTLSSNQHVQNLLTSVIDKILSHFPKCAALLSKVDDYTATTLLSFFDSLFNPKDQIRPACTDVGTEDVTTIACKELLDPVVESLTAEFTLIMHT